MLNWIVPIGWTAMRAATVRPVFGHPYRQKRCQTPFKKIWNVDLTLLIRWTAYMYIAGGSKVCGHGYRWKRCQSQASYKEDLKRQLNVIPFQMDSAERMNLQICGWRVDDRWAWMGDERQNVCRRKKNFGSRHKSPEENNTKFDAGRESLKK